ATGAKTIAASLRSNVDTFQISNVGQVDNHVRLEFQAITIDRYPHASLLYATGAAPAKTFRINFQRIHSCLLDSHFSMHLRDEFDFISGSQTQTGNRLTQLLLTTLLEHHLAGNQTWTGLPVRVVIQET